MFGHIPNVSLSAELYDVGRLDEHGITFATQWWTVAGFPILPIARYRVQFFPPKYRIADCKLLERKPLGFRSVLKTYLGGLFALFLIFAPLCFFTRSTADALGLPYIESQGNYFVTIGYMVWIVGVVAVRIVFPVRARAPRHGVTWNRQSGPSADGVAVVKPVLLPAERSSAKTYTLSMHGFPAQRRRLVWQNLLAIPFLVTAEAVLFYVEIGYKLAFWVLFLPVSIFSIGIIVYSLPHLIKRRQILWQAVTVEIAKDHVTVRHERVPGIRMRSAHEIRVRREEVAGIWEADYGLVVSTVSDPQALIIPAELDHADYREVALAISSWSSIRPGPPPAERILAQLRSVKRLLDESVPYRINGYVLAAAAVAWARFGLYFAFRWGRVLQIPESMEMLVLGGIVGVVIGFCWAFVLVDYILARTGARAWVRFGLWAGVTVAMIADAFAMLYGVGIFIRSLIALASVVLAFGLVYAMSKVGVVGD